MCPLTIGYIPPAELEETITETRNSMSWLPDSDKRVSGKTGAI